MFSSKDKGIEWSLDNDASNAAVLVASEAHAITLAVEGILGVVLTVATLTDEAIDVGEIESPRCEYDRPPKRTGKTAVLCDSMIDSLWLAILDAFSLIFSRIPRMFKMRGIPKQHLACSTCEACGVIRAVEPLNSFLASLCKFTTNFPFETEKKSTLQSPGSKREMIVDSKDGIVLLPKNVQALRTLFNVAHRLHNVLGPSWVLVRQCSLDCFGNVSSPLIERSILLMQPHSYDQEAWHPVRIEVSKLSTLVLMEGCDFILSQLIVDEHNLGERPLPNARLEVVVYVLHELARLVIHMDTVSELPFPPALKRSLAEDDNHFRRSHLLVLFPSFCELVGSRQSRIRELVQILLRLVAEELLLGKMRPDNLIQEQLSPKHN